MHRERVLTNEDACAQLLTPSDGVPDAIDSVFSDVMKQAGAAFVYP